MRRYLTEDVLEAARSRISWSFDRFEKLCVSFSGGKDSTVLLHLVMEEAVKRGRRVGVLFVDWEAQYRLTIDHVRQCLDLYGGNVEPYWACVPLRTVNAVSQIEPEWTCWDPAKRPVWVRELPPEAMGPDRFPFYRYPMTFEEFMPAFSSWYAGESGAGFFIGIRCAESKDRWLAIVCGHKQSVEGKRWTTVVGEKSANLYPIYDWRTQDDWVYLGRSGKPYNRLYDRMHQAGMSIHQMRICEPYGPEQRRSLWLYHVVEPETWSRLVARVAGANAGALYAGERGSVLGNVSVSKPDGMTWKSFADLLLSTMPPKTSEHYGNKVAVWRRFYEGKDVEIVEELPTDGKKDGPSWRRVCRTILRHDYWCRGIGFVPTKTDAYDRYLGVIRKRRERWGMTASPV